jgi:hypothetical protein
LNSRVCSGTTCTLTAKNEFEFVTFLLTLLYHEHK